MRQGRHHIWLLLAAGLLGLLSYFRCSEAVFPSASIDLKLTAPQVKLIASQWATKLNYNPAGAVSSTIFAFDDNAKTFLEYELGLEQANRLMKSEVIPAWYWSSRLCRPLQLEEFSTAVSPTGKLISFDHALENDTELPSIAHDQARKMAVDFIEKQAGQSIAGYKSVEDGSLSQPNRTDHYFSWEDTVQQFKGARLRTYIYISGNEITAYNHYLHIPEVWVRKFSELRSYNKALEDIASIFYLILNAATFFAFLWAFTSGLLRWRFAFGVALLVSVLDFLDSANNLPSSIHAYSTTMSFNGFLVDTYWSAARASLVQFLQTFALVGAAEALYRAAFPAKVALEKIFTSTGLRARQIFTGLIAGYGMFGVHLGWIIVYYLAGRDIGFWSPLEVRNVEGLSSTFPFFAAMYVGVSASVFEEFTYRVLGLSIFRKLVKHFWLANLLQALAWAFMHSNYPQEPPYARGLELTAVGLFYGFMLRRFGLLPCIISHFTFDSFLGITPLLSSPSMGLKLTALLAVVPFVIVLLVAAGLRATRGVQEEEPLINANLPPGAVPPQIEEIFPQSPYEYPAFSKTTRLVLAAIIAVSSVIQFGYFFPLVGQGTRLHVTREQALETARHYLLERGVESNPRIETAFLVKGIDTQEIQYLFEKAGFRKSAELAQMPGHPLVWQVRFFRLLDPLEYLVTLDSNGHPLALNISQAEEAEGGRLTQADARSIVEQYLKQQHAEVMPYKLQDVTVTERKARTDYNFKFNVPKFNIAGARFKVYVAVVGNMLSGFDQQWVLPDKWVFEQSRSRPREQVFSYIISFFELVLLVAAIWWAVGVARSGAIKWRPAIFLAGIVALLVIPQALNDVPEFFVGYSTDTPLLSYLTAQGVRQIITAVSSIAMVLGLAAFALASFRLLSPRIPLSAIVKSYFAADTAHSAGTRWNLWLDAVLAGFAAGLCTRAAVTLFAALHAHFSPVVSLVPLDSFCGLANVLSPALDSTMDGFTHGLQFTLVSAILSGAYAKYFKNFWGYLAFALLFSFLYPATERYWQDYAMAAAADLILFLITWVFVARLARLNLMAYFLAGACNFIAGTVRVLLLLGPGLYTSDIVILCLLLASPFLFLLYLQYRRSSPKAYKAESSGAL